MSGKCDKTESQGRAVKMEKKSGQTETKTKTKT